MKHLKGIAVLSLMTLFFSGLLSNIQAMNGEEVLVSDLAETSAFEWEVMEAITVEPEIVELSAMESGAVGLVRAMEEGGNEINIPVGSDFDIGTLHGYARMLYPEYYSLNWTVKGGIAHIQAIFSQPEQARRARILAQGLVADRITEEMTTPQKLRILHDLLVEVCQYDYDAAANPETAGVTSFTAYGALAEGGAVCDGYTAAYALLCDAAGIPCIAVFSPEMNHSWNALLCEGEILYVDVTYSDTSGAGEGAGPVYFLLTREALSATHIWDDEEAERILHIANQKNYEKSEKSQKNP